MLVLKGPNPKCVQLGIMENLKITSKIVHRYLFRVYISHYMVLKMLTKPSSVLHMYVYNFGINILSTKNKSQNICDFYVYIFSNISASLNLTKKFYLLSLKPNELWEIIFYIIQSCSYLISLDTGDLANLLKQRYRFTKDVCKSKICLFFCDAVNSICVFCLPYFQRYEATLCIVFYS